MKFGPGLPKATSGQLSQRLNRRKIGLIILLHRDNIIEQSLRMPTVEFDFVELTGLIGKNFSPTELGGIIPMLGVDMGGIDNEMVVVEVFPNRPDMLSVEGFARAMRGFLNIETGSCVYKVTDSEIRLFIESSVNKIRPCISGGILRELNIKEYHLKSIMDLQEKLHITHGRNRRKVAIGVHDLSRIEAPFFFKAVKPAEISFVPLDMNEKLNLGEILERHPKGREFAYIFEDSEKYPVITDKNNNVLSFPPIINSELTRVTEKTKGIFVEVTGTEQQAVDQALNIVITSIAEWGGRISSIEIIRK